MRQKNKVDTRRGETAFIFAIILGLVLGMLMKRVRLGILLGAILGVFIVLLGWVRVKNNVGSDKK